MFITGQKVVCIDDKAPEWIKALYTQWIKEGVTYVVRAVSIGVTTTAGVRSEGEILVLLIGVNNPRGGANGEGQERGFNGMRFKPLEEITTEEIMDQPELVGKDHAVPTFEPAFN